MQPFAPKSDAVKFDTCFFEQYAQISLSAILGSEFDSLENRDRPDLQSADRHSLGIEVTRAMEESKSAAQEMLRDVAGITPGGDAPSLRTGAAKSGLIATEGIPAQMQCSEDILRAEESGYSYGLQAGGFIGARELDYWANALPMRRILENKVRKVGNGFYGDFDKMGLFVFSRDNLGAREALLAMEYTISLQEGLDRRYDTLFLADIDDLFVCDLPGAAGGTGRMVRHPITRGQRRGFYLEAIRRSTISGDETTDTLI